MKYDILCLCLEWLETDTRPEEDQEITCTCGRTWKLESQLPDDGYGSYPCEIWSWCEVGGHTCIAMEEW